MLLNATLPEKHICKVSLHEQNQIPDHKEERKSIFYVNCGTQSPKFDKLFELITFAGMNRENQMEYLAELDKRLIRNSELQAAMENGEAKKARQTASIMKSKGLDLKLIAECTGLSIEEIEKL